ncbi:MAG: ThiF family adenylyltransferase [Patescibacteria group bacterium]
MENEALFSREIATGYRPEIVSRMVLLVLGAGAAGNNVAQTCAMTGVGEIRLVDMDVIEPTNAPRSPCFRLADAGQPKAKVLAECVAEMTYASEPVVRYANARAETLGLGIFEGVDAILLAFDSIEARAWATDQARLLRIPLVEIGFDGPLIHVSTWLNRSAESACFRCLFPQAPQGRASCTLFATRAIESGYLPAIQTAAAVAANIAVERIIQLLHGDSQHDAEYFELDVRTGRSSRTIVSRLSRCPGTHVNLPEPDDVVELTATVNNVFDIMKSVRAPCVLLPEPFVITAPCIRCGTELTLMRPFREAILPACDRCPNQPGIGILRITSSIERGNDVLAGVSLATLGFRSRDLVVVRDDRSDETATLRVDGAIDDLFVRVPSRGSSPPRG